MVLRICVSSIGAENIVSALNDALLCFQMPMAKIRGQCYDGCSAMAGARGVATKMQKLEPRAVFMRCYGHALNLSVPDSIKRSCIMKDCLDT